MGDRRLNLGRVAEEVVDEMEEEVVEQPRYNALSFRLLKDIRINDDGDPLSSNHTPPALATSSSHVADAGAGRFEDDGVDANDYRRGGETPHGDAIDDSPPSRTWKHRRGSSGSLASDRERRSALLGMMGFHWTKCVLVNLCVAGIVAAVVVPVVMLTGSKESGGGGAVTSSAGGGGGTLPPAAAVERRDALLAAVLRLPGLPYASSSSLADRESPQSRALDSLASSDAALPDLTDGNASSSWLAQRFALLTLYYSTNGDEWALNLGFTSGEDVCRWNRQVEEFGLGFPYKGVFCFDGDSVDSLVLCKFLLLLLFVCPSCV
uniref:Uncharacterized protein n=1 Tax=Odontella aurita TaxID=265563 RepID=A0A7S4JDL2_9STRA|mmetsp:Transcript_44386/g.135290  ORF Transcript_44386/g.135290 Transcript_44386/m.135290 type:complete len:321 (+) Transcript_44386:135-1097(+)